MTQRNKRAYLAGLAVCLLAVATDKTAGFEVIAHRGASASAPENTLSAFKGALAEGALHIELDVQRTRDGRVAVFHDRELAPKTSGSGTVADLKLATLQSLDLAPWFRRRHPRVDLSAFPAGETRIVSLRELFETLGQRPIYHIEIKVPDPALPDLVATAVERAGLEARVRISSFHLDQLVRIRGRIALPRCWLLPEAETLGGDGDPDANAWRRAAIERASSLGIDRVAFPALELERGWVEHAGRHGVGVRVWKVPNLEALRHAIEAGASGATVDWPGSALEWLRERGTTR